MKAYQHQIQYYETDRMGITHHSNYIRFMEEARTDLLIQLGYPYDRLESEGIISPVTAVAADYKATSTFGDVLTITTKVVLVKAAKLVLDYQMVNQDGVLVFKGHSEHGFLDKNGKFVSLKKQNPDFYQVLVNQLEEDRHV
ncbi:acyl-CoA thioesterase [uncultured Streptococcus sp.]|uniref:acyl-CoA thioesterase n=1 Tax=uncultured Streptococcus sp. TaxID=83427 RepID=UPI0027DAD6FB|nr:acyl-CoA thioesterase [uncultured Streptococcus sp.]